jgi:hypothetical protein
MSKPVDWLEQTWEIKRNIARRYAGVPMSEQLRDMRERLKEEFRKQGWPYPETCPAGRPTSSEKGKVGDTSPVQH